MIKRVDGRRGRLLRLGLGVVLGICAVSFAARADDPTAREFRQRAHELRAQGEPRGAIIELRNALQRDPKSAASRWQLGQLYVDIGKGAEAETELRRAITLGMDEDRVLAALGEALLLQGKFQEVIDEFEGRDDDATTRAGVLVMQGRARLGLAQLNEAETALEAAVVLDPQSVEALTALGTLALTRNAPDQAADHLARAQEIDPRGYEVKTLEGRVALARQDYKAATSAFLEASERRPFFALPLLGAAQAQLAADRPLIALKHINDVLRFDRQLFLTHYLRAVAFFELGEYESAEQYADAILGIGDQHIPSLLIRGASRLALVRNEGAINDLSRVVAAAPDNAYARRLLSQAQRRQGDSEQAYDTIVAGVERNPEDLGLLRLAGAMALRRGDAASGKKYLEQAVAQAPEDAALLAQYGLAQIALGEADAGLAALETAIEGDANLPQIELGLIREYLSDARWDTAIEAAQRFQERHPDTTLGLSLEATARFAAGDREGGAAALNRAVTLHPGDPEASNMLARIAMSEERFDEARRLYEAVLDHNADHVLTLVRLSRLEQAAGNEDAARGLRADAKATLDTILDRAPDNPILHELAGKALVDLGDLAAARKKFEAALETDPTYATARLSLARLDRAEGDIDSAARRYRQVIEDDPQAVAAMIGLAEILQDQEQFDEAVSWRERVRARDPEAVDSHIALVGLYMHLNQSDAAGDLARTLEETFPDNLKVLEIVGRVALAADDLEGAARAFARIAERVSGSAAHLVTAAGLQRRARDVAGARESLRAAIAQDPDHVPAYVALADLETTQGNPANVDGLIAELERTRPGDVIVDLLKGDRLMRQRRFPEAADVYAAGFEKAPRSDMVLRLFHAKSAAGEAAAALPILKDWVDGHPDDLEARRVLATGYVIAGDTQAAIVEHEKLLAERPDDVRVLNNLAVLYRKTDDPRAIAYAHKAYELLPGHPTTIDTLGWVLVQHGELERGLELLRKAAALAPHVPDIRYHLAVALTEVGRIEEARREVEAALRSGMHFDGKSDAEALRDRLSGS